MRKKCSKCGIRKSISNFHKQAGSRDGLGAHCKECAKETSRKNYLKNAEAYKLKARAWALANREKSREIKRNWALNNVDKILEVRERTRPQRLIAQAAYYQKNKEAFKQRTRDWRKNNRERRNAYERHLSATRPGYKEAKRVRNAISSALKGNQKTSYIEKYLGCTVPELRNYIESKFRDGMSWENYGKWHVDHIKPLAKFDLTIERDLKKVNHYSNLRPLWASENCSKQDREEWSDYEQQGT